MYQIQHKPIAKISTINKLPWLCLKSFRMILNNIFLNKKKTKIEKCNIH